MTALRSTGLPFGAGLTALAAIVAALQLTDGSTSTPPPAPYVAALGGDHPPLAALTSYPDCPALLAGLRSHTAALLSTGGLAATSTGGLVETSGVGAAAASAAAPQHSTTNDQEIGVDEPDIVKTDGRRVVTISDGVLRVASVAARRITATLDLGVYANAQRAQLFLAGERAMVILGGVDGVRPPRGAVLPAPIGTSHGGSTVLLVDLAGNPTVLATLHTAGDYLDARLADGTVRLVVRSAPRLVPPQEPGSPTPQRLDAARAAIKQTIKKAPLSAWLPSYTITTRHSMTTHTVPCQDVRHPDSYTGTALVTVYSLPINRNLTDPAPSTLAADGTTVYASTTSLYLASRDGTATQVHRFDISRPGRPRYLGSGRVDGQLFDPYAMSEYRGALRVVTTTGRATSVSILDAATLRLEGQVGELGRGEILHAIRFLGPLAYVVTYRSVDPLFVLDLHDPAHPRRAGELTVTGYSDYLHPTSNGRLLGVGESVNAKQLVTGLQVSLFDVADPAHPTRLARAVRNHTPSELPIDPHAFMFWPATGTAVVPIDSWNGDESGAAVVLHVGPTELRVQGTIRNPAESSVDGYDTGIERTLVIGSQLWTMSSAGLQISDLGSLARRAWLPFT